MFQHIFERVSTKLKHHLPKKNARKNSLKADALGFAKAGQ